MQRTTLWPALAVLLIPAFAPAQTLSDMETLSAEDRKAYWDSLSDEERDAQREAWRLERENMDPAELAAKRDERRAAAQAEWASLSAEEQQARKAEMRANREARRAKMREEWDSMTPEEQDAARAKLSDRRSERRQRIEERMASMSDEERAAAKQRMEEARERRAGGSED